MALPVVREVTEGFCLWNLQATASEGTQRKGEIAVNVNDAFPSRYIKASDLGDKRVLVTIDRVEIEEVGREKDSKPVVYFAGKEKGLVLNKTNAKKITEVSKSAETEEWAGVKVVLYATETEFGGDTVSCVRVAPPPKPAAEKPTAAPKPVPAPAPRPVTEADPITDDDVPF